jgi:hypothetical protein
MFSRHNDDQPKRGRPSVRRAWPLRAENRGQYSGCFATVLPEKRLRSDLCFPAKEKEQQQRPVRESK